MQPNKWDIEVVQQPARAAGPPLALLTKSVRELTIGYQAAVEEMKSHDRDEAERLSFGRKNRRCRTK